MHLLNHQPFSAMNFLVVDDNRLLNRFLTTFLRSKGHAASSLTDGCKTEAWLELNPCDAIILDMALTMSGIGMIMWAHREGRPVPDDLAIEIGSFIGRMGDLLYSDHGCAPLALRLVDSNSSTMAATSRSPTAGTARW